MALYYDLQVYKDVCRLTLLLFQYTKDFPKEYKYSLGEDIRRDSIVLVRSIYRDNKASDKTPELDSFMDDFEVLKFELRLMKDLHLISVGKYSEISLIAGGIGKQISGWRKTQSAKRELHGLRCMEES